MKQISKLFGIIILGGALVLSGCGASNTVKGTGIGAGAGAAVGAGVGAIAGGGKGAAWGAGIGAVLGGAAGAIIGNKMDKQAAELEQIEGAQVEKINEGEKDVFYTDDTHWSYKASEAISQYLFHEIPKYLE